MRFAPGLKYLYMSGYTANAIATTACSTPERILSRNPSRASAGRKVRQALES
jgi:hypothetical protein